MDLEVICNQPSSFEVLSSVPGELFDFNRPFR